MLDLEPLVREWASPGREGELLQWLQAAAEKALLENPSLPPVTLAADDVITLRDVIASKLFDADPAWLNDGTRHHMAATVLEALRKEGDPLAATMSEEQAIDFARSAYQHEAKRQAAILAQLLE